MIRLETVLDSWRAVREDTAAAVEDMPGGDLSFKATPELASFGEIARHILDASHGILGMLLAGVDNLQTPEFRERLKAYMSGLPEDATPAQLAAGLRAACDERISELKAQPEEFFGGVVTRFDGQRVTRLELIQFMKEHELTHRAQLFLYLRLKGVVPPTTRRRQANRPR